MLENWQRHSLNSPGCCAKPYFVFFYVMISARIQNCQGAHHGTYRKQEQARTPDGLWLGFLGDFYLIVSSLKWVLFISLRLYNRAVSCGTSLLFLLRGFSANQIITAVSAWHQKLTSGILFVLKTLVYGKVLNFPLCFLSATEEITPHLSVFQRNIGVEEMYKTLIMSNFPSLSKTSQTCFW